MGVRRGAPSPGGAGLGPRPSGEVTEAHDRRHRRKGRGRNGAQAPRSPMAAPGEAARRELGTCCPGREGARLGAGVALSLGREAD